MISALSTTPRLVILLSLLFSPVPHVLLNELTILAVPRAVPVWRFTQKVAVGFGIVSHLLLLGVSLKDLKVLFLLGLDGCSELLLIKLLGVKAAFTPAIWTWDFSINFI